MSDRSEVVNPSVEVEKDQSKELSDPSKKMPVSVLGKRRHEDKHERPTSTMASNAKLLQSLRNQKFELTADEKALFKKQEIKAGAESKPNEGSNSSGGSVSGSMLRRRELKRGEIFDDSGEVVGRVR